MKVYILFLHYIVEDANYKDFLYVFKTLEGAKDWAGDGDIDKWEEHCYGVWTAREKNTSLKNNGYYSIRECNVL